MSKTVELTDTELNTTKPVGGKTVQEALSEDAGLPILARKQDQIGAPYDGPPDKYGYPWGSSTEAVALSDGKVTLTDEQADALEGKHAAKLDPVVLDTVKKAKKEKLEAVRTQQKE